MDKCRLGAVADTRCEPDAVVVHLEDTAITGGTMVCAFRLWGDAFWTPAEGVKWKVVLVIILEGTWQAWVPRNAYYKCRKGGVCKGEGDEETGEDVEEPQLVTFRVSGVYGATEVVVSGPVSDLERLEAVVERLIRGTGAERSE